ncbi:helix-turn-helix domain-containing protein [Embleya sp. NPDC059259]|uniref:helix-turn-helix domain-containing protein n=1 Tax=unclassified Embleya TaxID=2699296 RepID=UPI003674D189
MPGTTGAEEADAFARLLRELKDRSGLSYGALAKRLHMGTSTLHRYCNGSAVPNDYAPVERFARVCRATPQELVELHRRWILADAARGRRADAAPGAEEVSALTSASASAGESPEVEVEVEVGAEAESESATSESEADAVPIAGTAAAATPVQDEDGAAAVVDAPPKSVPARRRLTVATAFAAVAAVLAVVMVVVGPLSGDGAGDTGDRREAGSAAAIPGSADAGDRSTVPAPASPPPGGTASPSAATTESGKAGPSASKGGTPSAGESAGAAPLGVGVRPYVYHNPCSQHFLVDSAPAQVGPPANEGDATRWAAAYGAVSSGEQTVALTVQGRDRDTVVLEALHVRIAGKSAPLAWNDYAMGVGCGGEVNTKSFDIDLDKGSPTLTGKNGQREFPYKVSASDPEVFYVTVHTKAHDVRWDLTLDWSSGDRRGTLRIDNKGLPFRTSADVRRPGYDYPLGGGEWVEREPEGQPDQPAGPFG